MFHVPFSRVCIGLAIAFTPMVIFSVNAPSHNDSTPALQFVESPSDTDKVYSSEIKTPGDVLIFISFSMPPASLKQWLIQADKIQAPLIVRGLVNHSFHETQAKLAEVAPDYKNSVVMDPRLFQVYQITTVPAVAVRNTSARACSPEESCWHLYPYNVVYGDVDLDYALQTIVNQGNNGGNIAERMLQQLRANNP